MVSSRSARVSSYSRLERSVLTSSRVLLGGFPTSLDFSFGADFPRRCLQNSGQKLTYKF